MLGICASALEECINLQRNDREEGIEFDRNGCIRSSVLFYYFSVYGDDISEYEPGRNIPTPEAGG